MHSGGLGRASGLATLDTVARDRGVASGVTWRSTSAVLGFALLGSLCSRDPGELRSHPRVVPKLPSLWGRDPLRFSPQHRRSLAEFFCLDQQVVAEVRDADAAMEELRRELARCELRRSAANACAEAARARLNVARGRRSGDESPLLDARRFTTQTSRSATASLVSLRRARQCRPPPRRSTVRTCSILRVATPSWATGRPS